MVDETTGKGRGWGPFELGRRYAEVEPGLGALHEAWHVRTGRAALVLLPGEGVQWRFQGRWQVRLSVEPDPPSMTLQVEQAPASVRVAELADMLVLMTAAVERVEESPQVHTHLEEQPVPSPGRGSPRAGRVGRSGWVGALAASSVLVLGLGIWLRGADKPRYPEPTAVDAAALSDAPYGSAEHHSDAAFIAYPLPARPFRNQTTAPCNTKRGEVAINNGCWIALKQRPPCLDDHAEYQGECYLPILKSERPPQANQP